MVTHVTHFHLTYLDCGLQYFEEVLLTAVSKSDVQKKARRFLGLMYCMSPEESIALCPVQASEGGGGGWGLVQRLPASCQKRKQ